MLRSLAQPHCAFVWPGSCILLLLALVICLPVSVAAQTITVQNGGTIEVSGGVWDLQGTTVDLGAAGSTASIAETGGRFTGGRLTATRDLSAPSSRDVAGLGALVSSGENLGATTVTRGHTIQTGSGNESIERFYEIDPTNNSSLEATLTLSYHDADLNGLTESTLELFRSTDGGQTWSEEGADSRDGSANTVTLSGISSFSRWTLGSTSSPLPVELAGFEAEVEREQVILRWQTASETNNAGFEVQHEAPDDASWTELGFVESKARNGTTADAKSYRYVAEDLSVGTHRFRLKQVDLDGSTFLTDPVTATLQMRETLRLGAPSPNPVRRRAAFTFAVKEARGTTVALFNVLGQRVRILYRGTPVAGEAKRIRLSAQQLSGLPSGTYFLRLQAGEQAKTRRLTVVR